MKNISTIILMSIIAAFTAGCLSGMKIVYLPKEKEFPVREYEIPWGQKKIMVKNSLTAWWIAGGYMDRMSRDPFDLHFLYSERREYAGKLLSIRAQVFRKDDRNAFSIELKNMKSDFSLEYFDGKRNVRIENLSEPLRSHIPREFPDLNYPEIVSFKFSYSGKFQMEHYPDELKVVFTMKWADGEKKFDHIVRRADYKPNPWHLKY